MASKINTFVTVIDRLKAVLGVKSNYQLAKLAGINPSNMSVWKQRDSIPYKMITRVCEERKINYNYILYGEGHPKVEGSFDVPKEKGLIPVVGLADAGPGVFGEDGGDPAGISDTYLSKPHGLKDQNAFGIRIEGDSMRPAFKRGHMVIVSPNMECQNGDVVVADLKKNGKILGEIHRKNGEITLKKYNADDIIIPEKELRWCYPVVWHKRR